MPYVTLPNGLRLWEGPYTPEEEMDLYRRMGGCRGFTSNSHRQQRHPPEAESGQDQGSQEETAPDAKKR